MVEKKEYYDIVYDLMATPIKPEKNVAHPYRNYQKQFISTYEFLGEVELLLRESVGHDPKVKEALVAMADFRELAYKICQHADNHRAGKKPLCESQAAEKSEMPTEAPQPASATPDTEDKGEAKRSFTSIIPKPTRLELSPDIFREKYIDALKSSKKAIGLITYEQQSCYVDTDPDLKEKIADFEIFKKDLTHSLHVIYDDLSIIWNELHASHKAIKLSRSGQSKS